MANKQTRSHSLIEATTNTVAGFFISYLLAVYLLPYWDLHPSHADAFEITFVYTLASFLRVYGVRRAFNG